MEMAKVTSKGQITIPVSIRRRLDINEGDKLLFIDTPEGVVMVNPDQLPGGKAEGALAAKPDAADAMFDTAVAVPSATTAEPYAEGADGPDAQPAPPEKTSSQQGSKLQGLDLNSLLSEIRSIGSNV